MTHLLFSEYRTPGLEGSPNGVTKDTGPMSEVSLVGPLELVQYPYAVHIGLYRTA